MGEKAGDEGELAGVEETAAGVTGLGPGVGEHEHDQIEAGGGECAEQRPSVIVPEAEVGRKGCGCGVGAFGEKGGQEGGDAAVLDLAGDDAERRIGLGEGPGVLATAETDLDSEAGGGHGEERVGGSGRGERNAEAWEGDFEQGLLPGAKAVATDAAVEAVGRGFLAGGHGVGVMGCVARCRHREAWAPR